MARALYLKCLQLGVIYQISTQQTYRIFFDSPHIENKTHFFVTRGHLIIVYVRSGSNTFLGYCWKIPQD